jgi:hypothetical protein
MPIVLSNAHAGVTSVDTSMAVRAKSFWITRLILVRIGSFLNTSSSLTYMKRAAGTVLTASSVPAAKRPLLSFFPIVNNKNGKD